MNDLNDIPRILRWKQVEQIIPWSKSYAYALIDKGILPRPQKLIRGGQAVGWLASDIDAYMQSLADEIKAASHE